MSELYYTAPAQELFDDLKENAIKLWQTYDNTYGYVDEKVNQIKDIQNVSDNFMYMVAMFDDENQRKLSGMIKDETRKEVALRIKDGGTPDFYNNFL